MLSKQIIRIYKYYWTFIDSKRSKKRRSDGASKEILIVKSDGLGDFILLIPVLQKLLQMNYKVLCIGPAFQKEIVDHLGLPVETVLLTSKNVKAFKNILNIVRNRSFTCAVNLSINAWGGIIVNQSRAALKVGLLQEREGYVYKGSKLLYDRLLSYKVDTHSFNVSENVFKDMLGECTVPEKIDVFTDDQKYILIHPYARWKPRIWPYFAELMQMLLDDGFTLKVVGTKKEHSESKLGSKFENHPNCQIIAPSSISDLLSYIESASVFIGNDSGPAHYASLIGKQSVVIWGPGFFERIHPLGKSVKVFIKPIECRPCRQKGAVCKRGDSYCLQSIELSDVYKYIRSCVEPFKNR